MGWSDKFLNPAWHKIQSLSTQECFEVSVILTLHGHLRVALQNEFVISFERLCDPHAPASLLKGAFGPMLRDMQKLWPIGAELRTRLVDEIELGLLSCFIRKPLGTLKLEVLNSEIIFESAGCIALAEINKRLGRQEPAVLNKTGYSHDPDECKLQVILSWMRLTGLQNPQLPGIWSDLFFAKQWKFFLEDFLKGFCLGLSRIDRETFLTRTRQECRQLNSRATDIISYLCEKITQRRLGRGEQSNSRPPQEARKVPGASQRRDLHPAVEYMMQVGDLLKHGDASSLIYAVAQNWLKDLLRDYEHVRENAPPKVKANVIAIRKYVGSEETGELTTRQYRKFVDRFEHFLFENTAPSADLAEVFNLIKGELEEIYYGLSKFGVSDDIRDWHDRVLSRHSGKIIIAP